MNGCVCARMSAFVGRGMVDRGSEGFWSVSYAASLSGAKANLSSHRSKREMFVIIVSELCATLCLLYRLNL